jgi:hypothetical protein
MGDARDESNMSILGKGIDHGGQDSTDFINGAVTVRIFINW